MTDPTPDTPLTRADIKALEDNQTPNLVIPDPNSRSKINSTLSILGLGLGTVMVVDMASPAFDLSAWTEPIFVGYAYVAAAFGLTVTRPNYPKL